MSERGKDHDAALDAFKKSEDEIKEAFMKRADEEDEKINLEGIYDLLADISIILAFDCEGARSFFKEGNNKIPEGYDLNSLSFEEFNEIFEIWLKESAEENDEVDEEEEDEEEEEEEGEKEAAKSKAGNSTHRTNGQKVATPKSHKSARPATQSNYAHNKEQLAALMAKHKEEYELIFKSRLPPKEPKEAKEDEEEEEEEEEEEDVGTKTIPAMDCFGFLQECFYIDNVDLKESINDQDDFFRNVGSYKKLMKLNEAYHLQEKKADSKGFDVREAQMTFDDIFKFLDFWLKTDPKVILTSEKPPEKAASILDVSSVKGEEQQQSKPVSPVKDIKQTMQETIQKYEKLIKESNDEVEKSVLQGTVDALRKKLFELTQKKNKKVKLTTEADSPPEEPVKKLSKPERKAKALKDIYNFYCQLQLNVGRSCTFEKLDRISSTINIGTFRLFMRHFRLKVEHYKLIELYHKTAGKDENLIYQEFENLLNKVALQAEIAPEPKAHVPKPEIMKDYKPTSYKDDESYKIFKEKEAIKQEDFAENAKKKKRSKTVASDPNKDAEKLEEIWNHMGLYTNAYKKFMKTAGGVPAAVSSEFLAKNPTTPKYKMGLEAVEGKTVEEFQDEVNHRNELRQLIKDIKGVEKALLPDLRGSSSPEKLGVKKHRDETYLNLQNRKDKAGAPDVSKLTLKKVERILYNDMRKVDERFNPHELIDDNDEEDNVFLAEYNINAETKQMREKPLADKKKIEKYGQIKKPKGFAVNGKYGGGYEQSQAQEMAVRHSDEGSYGGHYGSADSRGYASPKSYMLSRQSPNSQKYLKGPTYLDYEYPGGQSVGSGSYGYNSYNSGYSSGSYLSNSQNYGQRSPGYNHAVDRANQVEQDLRRREQQVMDHYMSIQKGQVKKGLKAVGK